MTITGRAQAGTPIALISNDCDPDNVANGQKNNVVLGWKHLISQLNLFAPRNDSSSSIAQRPVSGEKELLVTRMEAISLSPPDQFACHIRGKINLSSHS